jgi:hypothetical protein
MASLEERRAIYEQKINSIDGIRFIEWKSGFKNNTSRPLVSHSCGYKWTPVVASLISGKGCPKCSGRLRPSPEEYIRRINKESNHTFVDWCSNDRSPKCYVIVKCALGHEMRSALYNIVGKSLLCAECSGRKRRTSEYREQEINSIAGMTFIRWVNGYSSSKSRVIVRHSCGLEREARVADLISGRHCPACTKYGFNPAKDGTVYFLESSCGEYIKVGIANNAKRRIAELRRETPFAFTVAAQIRFQKGSDARKLEKFFHGNFEGAGLSGFSGSTEWMISHDDILYMARMVSTESP